MRGLIGRVAIGVVAIGLLAAGGRLAAQRTGPETAAIDAVLEQAVARRDVRALSRSPQIGAVSSTAEPPGSPPDSPRGR